MSSWNWNGFIVGFVYNAFVIFDGVCSVLEYDILLFFILFDVSV